MPKKIANPAAYYATVAKNKAKAAAVSHAKKLYKKHGASVKRQAGKYLSNAARKGVSHLERDLVGSFLGSGSYTGPETNAIVHMHSHQEPKRKYEGSKFIVEHREYIGDLITSSATTSLSSGAGAPFTSQTYNINPGLTGIFPWLSQIAQGFSKYRFKKLIFHAKSTTSDAISSSNGVAAGLGEMVGAIQYDVASGAYSNYANMANSEGAICCKPSCSFVMGVEVNKRDTPYEWYYVRGGSQPANTDIRLYDYCLAQFATQNVPASVSGGAFVPVDVSQIWIEYVCEFDCPIVGSFNAIQSAHYVAQNSTSSIPTNAHPLGTGGLAQPVTNNALPITFNSSGTQMNFPIYITEGSFLVTFVWSNASGQNVKAPTISAIAGTGSLLTMFTLAGGTPDQQAQAEAPGNDANNTLAFSLIVVVCYSINAPGSLLAGLTVAANGTIPTALNQTLDIYVTPYNSNML